MVEPNPPSYDYDIFIIGGGSGGLSAAKEAALFNVKVGLADFVTPSPKGTKWGLGGTCVNVGCIPKKMMHYASLLYDQIKNFKYIGYPSDISTQNHNWNELVSNVQGHISSLNFGYKNQLRQNKIKYYNKIGKVIDKNKVELTDAKGNKEIVTSKYILLAVGLRPNYTTVQGAKEYCITSDDLFSLKKAPGKTLIVGASYISLESAGLLAGLKYDVTVMVRSILLRGFDRDMAERVGKNLEKNGVKFINKSVPILYEKSDEKIKVTYTDLTTDEKKSDIFDTVLIATGRIPITSNLIDYEKVPIKLSKSNKIITNEYEQTNLDNIYAIGDCAEGRPELTPPAIMAGKLLARRLFNNETTLMDYSNIATTVFTPVEYGHCGYSEEDAYDKLGKDNVDVFHSEFKPLEWTFDFENEEMAYMKIIVDKGNDKVVGFHLFGPNAGEITQGVALAMKCGVTKKQLDLTVGIHPTVAEEMTGCNVNKNAGSGKKGGC